jgi:hypothetical protein
LANLVFFLGILLNRKENRLMRHFKKGNMFRRLKESDLTILHAKYKGALDA